MRATIGKEFTFDAAHRLPDDPCYGSCRRLHGHTYRLLVEIEGEVGEKGWVCDFAEIKAMVQRVVLDKYDHAYVNDLLEVPTAENMARHVYELLRAEIKDHRLKRVKLYETPTSYAEING